MQTASSKTTVRSKLSRAKPISKTRKSTTSKNVVSGQKGKSGKRKIAKEKIGYAKRKKAGKAFFSNKYRFKFGWSPFDDFVSAEEKAYQEVFDLLCKHHEKDGLRFDRNMPQADGAPQGPVHAADAVMVDALIKVMLSQATNNENAIAAHAMLVKAFPYLVDGKKVFGKTPDYHLISRSESASRLTAALQPSGFQNERGKSIQRCLQMIRTNNKERGSPGSDMDANPVNAGDFVPGSLSLDYLAHMNTQQKFDELVSLPGVGVKTAACLLAFSYQLPVFAVDTHVFRLVKWLNWIPSNCDRDGACAHLDTVIPDGLKYGLHQAFWHHGQKCLRCMARNDQKTEGWEKAVCPIEAYLARQPRKERKAAGKKRKAEELEEAEDDMPKAKKANKALLRNATADGAVPKGMELTQVVLEDAFGSKGGNITNIRKYYWMKKFTDEDGEEVTETEEGAEQEAEEGAEQEAEEDAEQETEEDAEQETVEAKAEAE